MCQTKDWSQWLEGCRLDDAALAEAYEAVPAEHRALVKHCLALWHALYGEDSEYESRTRHDATLGLSAEESHVPAPWALVVLGPGYAAPTRLAAALMPAILARVPRLAVLCTGGMPSAATRVTLELAGVEDIFCAGLSERADMTVQADMAERCLRELASGGKGSVVLLHRGALGSLADLARNLDLPLWEEKIPPSIHGLTPSDLAQFCHADARNAAPYDAVFDCVDSPAPLQLSADMLCFWQHQGLGKAFFRRTRIKLASATSLPDGAAAPQLDGEEQ